MPTVHAPRSRDPDSDPGVPHPVLDDYYESEADRRGFLDGIFDDTSADYDRIEKLIGFGSGRWYRHQALLRAGLGPGMRVVDVGVGTGLVAREAAAIVGDAQTAVGVDARLNGLAEAGERLIDTVSDQFVNEVM